MAWEAVYRALEDGRTAVMDNDHGSTDPCAVGEPLLAACNYSRSPVLKKGYDKLLLWALDKAPRNKDGVVYHLADSPSSGSILFICCRLFLLPQVMWIRH